jgi:2-oxoglutarate ferredoxin oxidoreductase subunit alpha
MMIKKRFKKLKAIPKKYLRPKIYGPKKANLTIVGWGSTKTSVLDAIKYLNKDGFKVNYMHFLYINPIDENHVKKMLENCNDTIILEGNYTAQLRDIIREKTGFYIEKTYLKYDGRPFFYEDIIIKIKEVMKK